MIYILMLAIDVPSRSLIMKLLCNVIFVVVSFTPKIMTLNNNQTPQ